VSDHAAQFEVRLLGGLQVVRADGSTVDPGAWGTAKTMDLLRVLALENGRGVRATTLVDRLWPHVDPARGRGSLRTAASRIRQAVGHDCIRRQQGDLVLVGARVDVSDYRQLVVAIRQAAARAAWDETMLLTEAAEAMYAGDFHASDDSSGWAVFARTDLRQLRQSALADATQCALATQRFREARELAQTRVLLDASSEAAHRDLMRAHAELGEIGQALRVFESYRSTLADELGVDPSRLTRDLHMRLLQDPQL
jgi:DNA-binding SARP family transcriptional activator